MTTQLHATFSGDYNHGSQIGHNSGTVNNNFKYESLRSESPPVPTSTVPFRRDRDFVDRETILDDILGQCSEPAARVALVGLGGVGKSQIAIEFSHRVREQSPSTWVFWVHAANAARFEQGYRDIAEAVRIQARNDPQADVLQLVYNWLCDERKGKWVIIVDNADDGSIFFKSRGQNHTTSNDAVNNNPERSLSAFLPQSPNGFIVITSRDKHTATRLAGSLQDVIDVKPMNDEQGLVLLWNKLGDHLDHERGPELIEALDYMPLAITQAAAYICQRAPRSSVAKYLQDLHSSEQSQASLLNYDKGDLRRDLDASNSIIMTWQISFDYLRSIQPSAADLLSLMSFFDRQGIPDYVIRMNILDDTCGEEANETDELGTHTESENSILRRFEEDVDKLRAFALITTDTSGHSFEMHRMVQFTTRRWLDEHGEMERWKQAFISRLYRAFPEPGFEEWTICQTLFPHAEVLTVQQPLGDLSLFKWARILQRAGRYAFQQADYTTSNLMLSKAYETLENMLGMEHYFTLLALIDISWLLRTQGLFEDATEIARRALSRSKSAVGSEHRLEIDSMHTLAVCLTDLGQYREAEGLQREAVELRTRQSGADDARTRVYMQNLANIYSKTGDFVKAAAVLEKLVAQTQVAYGMAHLGALAPMNSLAMVYQDQGRYQEAEKLQEQVLETMKRVLGEEHPGTLTAMSNLAGMYRMRRRYQESETMLISVLEARRKITYEEHPEMLVSMNSLALTLESQGKYQEAEEVQSQVFENSKRVLGDEHPITITVMNNLASIFLARERYQEAENLHSEAFKISKRLFGAEDCSTLVYMHDLACTWREQGRDEEALLLMEDCSRMRSKVIGDEHPQTVSSMCTLSSMLHSQERYAEAKELDTKLFQVSKRVFGGEHPYTLAAIKNLAITLERQGRCKEAISLMAECVQELTNVHGAEHLNTIETMRLLAGKYYSQGRYAEAEALDTKVFEVSKRVLGGVHPDTLAAIENLAITLERQGRCKEAISLMAEFVQELTNIHGAEHLDTMGIMRLLAEKYYSQERYEEAEDLNNKLVESLSHAFGEMHRHTLKAMHNLAVTCKMQRKYKKAISLLEECVQKLTQNHGVDDPETAEESSTLLRWQTEALEINVSATCGVGATVDGRKGQKGKAKKRANPSAGQRRRWRY